MRVACRALCPRHSDWAQHTVQIRWPLLLVATLRGSSRLSCFSIFRSYLEVKSFTRVCFSWCSSKKWIWINGSVSVWPQTRAREAATPRPLTTSLSSNSPVEEGPLPRLRWWPTGPTTTRRAPTSVALPKGGPTDSAPSPLSPPAEATTPSPTSPLPAAAVPTAMLTGAPASFPLLRVTRTPSETWTVCRPPLLRTEKG